MISLDYGKGKEIHRTKPLPAAILSSKICSFLLIMVLTGAVTYGETARKCLALY